MNKLLYKVQIQKLNEPLKNWKMASSHFSILLTAELQKIKDEMGGIPRKRKRTAKHDTQLHFPSTEVHRTFNALGDVSCTPFQTMSINTY
jgi:hypothetical protein